MLAEERFNRILNIVEEKKSVTVTELTELLDTSESTIRRDLTTLDKRKKLIKVHGGATAVDMEYMTKDSSVSVRQDLNREEKIKIGKYAAGLIRKDDFVYIDAGTSTEYLVEQILEKEAVYVTNGISHARKLLHKGCRVFLLGGELKKETEALIGAEALESLEKYNFRQCRKKYILADSSKIGQISLIKFAELKEAEVITTKLKQGTYQKYKNIVEVDEA